MKPILMLTLALLMVLPSCVVSPTVVDHADGSTTATMGIVLAARRKNVVAYIKTRNGTVMKYMSEEEAGEDVPIAITQAVGAVAVGKATAHSQDLKTTTDGTVAIGAQKAGVAKAKIAAESAAEAGEQANEALRITKGP